MLSDSQKKAIYDQYGEEGLNGQIPTPSNGATPFSGTSHSGFRFNSRSADEIFSEFFGFSSPFNNMEPGGTRRNVESFNNVPRKAAPIEQSLFCNLEELYNGTSKKMKISREVLDHETGYAVLTIYIIILISV